MRLRDDLDVLATGAPAPPDPELLLRRARTIRHRRAVVAPAVAVVAVLVLTITYLSRVDDGGPMTTLAFRLEQPSDPAGAELVRARDVLLERARFLGLKHAQARIEGDRILLDFVGDGDGPDPKRLTAPGNLQVRKVIETVDDAPPSTPSPELSVLQPAEASTLDDVIAKLTPAVYSRALSLRAVGEPRLLPGFERLTPQEVALLPLSIQLYVPTISCRQLARTTPPPGERAVVCYDDLFKLLLERSALGGKQVAATTTGRDSETGLDEVRLRLTSAGQEKWSAVSTEAANAVDCRPVGDNHCQLAFLLDGKVLSTPEILRPLAADEARITLGSAAEARMIAATLGPRELPSGVKLDR